MEKFVISKTTNGEFKYEFVDNNEQLIFSKSGYKNRGLCMNAIESIRRNIKDDSKFYRKRTPTDECYFNLKASNGQIIGISKVFEDKASREETIQHIKIASTVAPVEDISKKQKKESLA